MGSVTERVERELLGWPGVEARPHRFNGVEFRVRGHEIGYLHGDRLADLPFPRKVRERLVAEGKAQLHHVLPETGWASYPIRGPEDVDGAIALFRLNYERLARRGATRSEAADAVEETR